MILFFQIFLTCFALFMVYWVTLQWRRQIFSQREHRIWIFLWAAFLVLTYFPSILQGVVDELRVSSVFDLLVVVSMMIVVFLVLEQRVAVLRLRQKFEDFVRQDAKAGALRSSKTNSDA